MQICYPPNLPIKSTMPYNHSPRPGRPPSTGPRWATIYPGSVLWFDGMPQTLAPSERLHETGQVTKRRPAVALKKLMVKVDLGNICTEDAYLPIINSTSQEHLTEGRPGIECSISKHNDRISHFWFDTLQSLPLKGERIEIAYSMTGEERTALTQGLDQVLQPERRFFLKQLFNAKRGGMPGQVWTIEIPSDDPQNPVREVDALVLLRRGPFFINEDETGHVRFTPYLVAVLPGPFKAADMRGLSWRDIRLMAVHERSLRYPVGKLTDETVGILLNTLRRDVNLPAITYQQPLLRHLFLWLNPARVLALPRPGGM